MLVYLIGLVAVPLVTVAFAPPRSFKVDVSIPRARSRLLSCSYRPLEGQGDGGTDPNRMMPEVVNRREALQLAFSTAFTMLLGKPQDALALEMELISDRRTFESQEFGYSVAFPSTWRSSPRTNRLPLQSGTSSTGTVLVAADYVKGLSLSITCSDIRKLLEEMSLSGGGRLVTVRDIGKALVVADVLLRQRDGIMEEKNPLSRVMEAREEGSQLDFTVETLVKLIRTGVAPAAKDIDPDPIIKRTRARSFLRNNGEMVTVWVSALADSWGQEDVSTSLNEIVDSFVITSDTSAGFVL